jgi:hypothetical protein
VSIQWVCHTVGGAVPARGGHGGGGGGRAAPTELVDGHWQVIGREARTASIPVVPRHRHGGAKPWRAVVPADSHLVCYAIDLPGLLPPGYGAVPVPGFIPGYFTPGLGGPGILGAYPGFFGPGGIGGLGAFGGFLHGPQHQPVIDVALPAPGPLLDVAGGPTVPGGTTTIVAEGEGPTPVPEPASVAVFAMALLALAAVRRFT